MAKKNSYTEDSIKVLEYPKNIQSKPGMYIGCIDVAGNTHLIREVIDNSVDEILNGYGHYVKINISNKKSYCVVEDEGRGIPAKAIEKAFCTIHASGKFDNDEYATAAGTHGVGCTAVNALSKLFIVECTNDGIRYRQEFSNGLPTTKLMNKGKTKQKGTTVAFTPNPEFMDSTEFDIETIAHELRDKAYILPGVEFIITNDDEKKTEIFKKDSLLDFVNDNIKTKLNEDINFTGTVNFKQKNGRQRKFEFEIAFAYDKTSKTIIKSFCNSLLMREGGIQETQFKMALTRFIKNYIEENKLLGKKGEKLEITGDHVLDGLVCIISIKHPCPIFENQTKNKLTNKEISGIQKIISEKLKDYADVHPKDMKNICNKIILSAKASEAAKKAKETVTKKGESQFSIVSDLSKLSNCISKDTSENEIFITEGRSASGTANIARDKRTQAVYSLRGKMLNTINMEEMKVLANKECADLAYILTDVKNGIDKNFNINNLKYGKVIMLCDADVDGYHISMLGLTFIFEHMLDIITTGHMYVAIPPLYSIIEKGKKRYFVDQKEYDDYIYERIWKDYDFIDETDKRMKPILIKEVFNKYEELSKYIQNISDNNLGLTKTLLLDIFNEVMMNGYSKEVIKDFLKEFAYDVICNKISYEGFYENEYVYFNLNDIIKIFNNIFEFIEENEIPSGDIYYKEKDSEEYFMFNIKEYDTLIKEVTPKSRVRLKGLGEMDADELKNTTMDKEYRNLYKIEIPDIEKAKESMNNYMNGNSKYADFRKTILLTKQDD